MLSILFCSCLLHGFWGEVDVILISASLYRQVPRPRPHGFFQDFFLYLWFSGVWIVYAYAVFWFFFFLLSCVCVCVCVSSILFVVLWISWICDLVSDIILRNSQSLLLQIVLLFLYPFILLPVFSLHICYTFVVVHSSWMFCSHFSHSLSILCFSVLEVSVAMFSSSKTFLIFPIY